MTTKDAAAKAKALKTVAYWERHPDSFPARLYARMLAGEWVDVSAAVDEGKAASNVSQAVMSMRAAGLPVETERTSGNAMRYRIRPARGGGKASKVTREVGGETHPHLGAVLTVRALAIDDGGDLVVHLSNGNGSAWVATITGHVG